jgi:antirestriction protein ArdC
MKNTSSPSSTAARHEMQREALSRALSGQSMANFADIYSGFSERGIPESEILPRVNVFTFNAWKALGRFVRKGEKGVRVFTWIVVGAKDREGNPVVDAEGNPTGRSFAKTSFVFHVSQTEKIEERGA